MKKNIFIGMLVLALLFMLTACNTDKQGRNDPTQPPVAETGDPTKAPYPDVTGTSDATATLTPTIAPANTEESPTTFELIVTAEDGFYTYGYTQFVCPNDGDYSFDMQSGDTDAVWSVYVLDSEFTDALRYLSQANTPALSESGSITIEAGQFVYIYCSVNSNSASEPAYGASVTVGLS